MPQGKPRDPRKEQSWRERIERWRRSGLSVRAFCQQQHLAIPSFYAWRRTLQQRDRLNPTTPAPQPLTFLPVHVTHDDTATLPVLELLLANGRRLRIPHGYDPNHLGDVVRALEGLPC